MALVVAAVIHNEFGELFMQLRAPHRDYPLTWECPGGKVDGVETEHAALARELQEELGLSPHRIRIAKPYTGFHFEAPRPCTIHFYEVLLIGEPTLYLRDGIAMGWFNHTALQHVPLTPGGEKFFAWKGWL